MAEAPSIVLRAARADDLEALEWEGEYRRYRVVYQRAYAESLRGRRVLLVAELQGLIIGQIFIQVDSTLAAGRGEAAYLYALRVRPEYRGRGIGTDLVREAEALLRQRGYARALISVAKDNDAARRLYERLGFEVFGEDAGNWTYIDDQGQVQEVHEPAFLLETLL
jgi:ribosomal protein S18 acetylase RimI-like enzyme